MHAPNFRSVGSRVQPVERKQTDRQTDGRTLPKILPLPLMREVNKLFPTVFLMNKVLGIVHLKSVVELGLLTPFLLSVKATFIHPVNYDIVCKVYSQTLFIDKYIVTCQAHPVVVKSGSNLWFVSF